MTVKSTVAKPVKETLILLVKAIFYPLAFVLVLSAILFTGFLVYESVTFVSWTEWRNISNGWNAAVDDTLGLLDMLFNIIANKICGMASDCPSQVPGS